jgi:hypothetical protein
MSSITQSADIAVNPAAISPYGAITACRNPDQLDRDQLDAPARLIWGRYWDIEPSGAAQRQTFRGNWDHQHNKRRFVCHYVPVSAGTPEREVAIVRIGLTISRT